MTSLESIAERHLSAIALTNDCLGRAPAFGEVQTEAIDDWVEHRACGIQCWQLIFYLDEDGIASHGTLQRQMI